MSEARRVHNPGPGEVVYNQAGQVLAAYESVPGDLSDPVTSRLVSRGRLLVPEPAVPEPPAVQDVAGTVRDEREPAAPSPVKRRTRKEGPGKSGNTRNGDK